MSGLFWVTKHRARASLVVYVTIRSQNPNREASIAVPGTEPLAYFRLGFGKQCVRVYGVI